MARPKSNGDDKGVNKSQAIRDILSDNPSTKTREIVAKLAEKGISVTNALVYLIKSKQKQTRKRHKREQAAATASKQTGFHSPVALIVRVKELAREVGGYKTLKQLVDVLAE